MRYVTLILVLLFSFPIIAQADEVLCSDREDLVEHLVTQYDEQLAAVKDVKGEGRLEMYVSAETGTWTALLTQSDNLSCVLADGQNASIPEFLKDIAI